MKKMIISWEKSPRRSVIEEEFKRQNLEFSFFSAVMGKELSESELRSYTVPEILLAPGEIGCAVSHLEALKDFLNSQDRVVSVFEDDVKLTSKLTEEQLEWIGDYLNKLDEPALLLLRRSEHAYKEECSFNGVSIYRAFTGTSAFAYMVNRKGAAAILRVQTPIRFEYDIYKYYVFLQGLSVFSLSEDLVYHEDNVSEIGVQRGGPARDRQRKAEFKRLMKELPFSEKWRIWKLKARKSLWEIFRR